MASPHHPWLLRETRRYGPLMPALVVAPAGATLGLGLVYWLLRERAPDGLEPDGIQ